MIDISCCIGTDDCELFTDIVNQGIDARLEVFTESEFYINDSLVMPRFHFDFDDSEGSILLRRMIEKLDLINPDDYETENDYFDAYDHIGMWIDDILMIYYEIDENNLY